MAVGLGREPGGIAGLTALIDEHQAAFDYDWRTRFHLPASVIGEDMGWDEAIRLAGILRADPSSMLAASMEGWTHPVSREALILMDQFDLDMAVNSGKKTPQPHPGRPWKQKGEARKFGNTAGRSRAEVVEILNRHGHNLPV